MSMRLSRPTWPKICCAPARSIAKSGVPAAAILPAMRSAVQRGPFCSSMVSPSATPSALRAAALANANSGFRLASRSSAAAARGQSAGAKGAMLKASMPSTRSGTRRFVAVPAALLALVLPVLPIAARAWVSISSTGLASATAASSATRSNSASSKPSRPLRNTRSGSPLALRTAAENSSSAERLIRCTDHASATPKATASSATAWRHGWARHSRPIRSRSRLVFTPGARCRWRTAATRGRRALRRRPNA
jgi:hypothetical protein